MNRLILANTVNEFTSVPSVPEHSASSELTAAQEIWLARPGDILVTPRPLAPDFKQTALDAMGLQRDDVLTLSPHVADGESLPDAIRRAGMMEILRAAIRDRNGCSIRASGQDRPLIALAEDLEVPIEGYALRPKPALIDQLNRLNTKSGFRATATRIGLPTAPGARSSTIRDAVCHAEEIIGEYGAVVLKRDCPGGTGSQLRLSREQEPGIERDICRWLGGRSGDSTPVILEALLILVREPTAEVLVDEAGPSILSTGLMHCRNGVFWGMDSPAHELEPNHKELLTKSALELGRYLHALGYRGTYDVDAGVTSNGNMVFFESNIRRTITTTYSELASCDSMQHWPWRLVARAFSYRGEAVAERDTMMSEVSWWGRGASPAVLPVWIPIDQGVALRVAIRAPDSKMISAVEMKLLGNWSG